MWKHGRAPRVWCKYRCKLGKLVDNKRWKMPRNDENPVSQHWSQVIQLTFARPSVRPSVTHISH